MASLLNLETKVIRHRSFPETILVSFSVTTMLFNTLTIKKQREKKKIMQKLLFRSIGPGFKYITLPK